MAQLLQTASGAENAGGDLGEIQGDCDLGGVQGDGDLGGVQGEGNLAGDLADGGDHCRGGVGEDQGRRHLYHDACLDRRSC